MERITDEDLRARVVEGVGVLEDQLRGLVRRAKEKRLAEGVTPPHEVVVALGAVVEWIDHRGVAPRAEQVNLLVAYIDPGAVKRT